MSALLSDFPSNQNREGLTQLGGAFFLHFDWHPRKTLGV